jgi:hypothetical protein
VLLLFCAFLLVPLLIVATTPALRPVADPGNPLDFQGLPLHDILGFACDKDACHPVEIDGAASREAGLVQTGAIDLTGDGTPEQVERTGDQVVVYQDGVEVWRCPPEWQVADLALGDPNDDGRFELLLAFWKPDAAGAPRSHPFIVGYRQGLYRTLWGGSAVSDPIHEVALGDVDGDGAQELVVLEELDGGPERAVAVWHWHGWGFSLGWRSPGDHYRDLVLVPNESGQPPTIRVVAER